MKVRRWQQRAVPSSLPAPASWFQHSKTNFTLNAGDWCRYFYNGLPLIRMMGQHTTLLSPARGQLLRWLEYILIDSETRCTHPSLTKRAENKHRIAPCHALCRYDMSLLMQTRPKNASIQAMVTPLHPIRLSADIATILP